ncbi:MAG: adaptor protein MecA [Acetanaerobacterium sp.]
MIIKAINSDKIKILLTLSDMERLKLTYEELDYQSPSSKRAISELLSFAKAKTGFDFTGARLYIEAFSNGDGSCTLLFTKLDKEPPCESRKKPFVTDALPVIYEFDHLDNATRFARACLENISPLALYSMNGHYRLVLGAKSAQRMAPMLAEFGRLCGSGLTDLSFLDEHGKLLLTRNTLKTLKAL